MGLFHATKKRMIVSWSVSFGVAAIVAAVKRLPYPWRNIVDAGVVVGLTWGSLSILIGYGKALVTGKLPEGVDPALPEKTVAEKYPASSNIITYVFGSMLVEFRRALFWSPCSNVKDIQYMQPQQLKSQN